jgi:tetratricopeptide (TPR) repeat protein
LDSWKSIADYLGRGQRTVQRWHADFGMPVHHFGGAKGSVFAFIGELDDWVANFAVGLHAGGDGHGSAADARCQRSQELTAKAEVLWNSRSERNLSSITALYRDAISEDPDNLAALLGFSRSLISAALFGVADSSVAYPSAMEALRRVPQVSSNDPDAKCTDAWLKMAYRRQWREALAGFDDVLRENPRDSFALAGRALLYIAEENLAEAFDCALEAWQVNPLATPLTFLPCWIQYLDGACQESLELAQQAKTSGAYGSMIAAVEALALTQTGPIAQNLNGIEEIAAGFQNSWTLLAILGYGYAVCDQTEKAWEILGRLRRTGERKRRECGYLIAIVLLGLGEKREAVSFLEESYTRGSLWSLGFHSDPLLLQLRGNARFEALLRKIGPAIGTGGRVVRRFAAAQF